MNFFLSSTCCLRVATKKIITTATYQLDETLPTGPAFGLQYDGGLFFNKYCENSEQNKAPSHSPESKVYLQINNNVIEVEIIAIPTKDDGIYSVQYPDGQIHQIHESNFILSHPQAEPSTNDPRLRTFPKWIHNNAKCTIYLNSMTKPSQGHLFYSENKWVFKSGHKHHNSPISLPDFEKNVYNLITTFQLFKGHQTFRKIIETRSSFNLGTIVARHVSAISLSSTDAPNLLKHCKLNKNDKEIWDNAYKEEYTGLRDLPAWITISEQEYESQKHKYGPLLPTMAISTVKFDEHGSPKRAKYRIVALGNLDPHDWTKPECFAPVMSQLELRLITAIAVKHKRTLKSGDFKQAFVQALLPPEETYVLRPPPGCPLTPKNSFWLLKRSLYGLKRAPHHWYEKASAILQIIGLKPLPNAPCLFKEQIEEGKPPIYLGLYVDDFVYFSTDPTVEKAFETKLSQLTSVDFMGEVSHFLGIRFQWRKTQNRVKAHLSQEAFADSLVQLAGLSQFSTKYSQTPYRSGYPVDTIKTDETLTTNQQNAIRTQYQRLVGSLLWLSQSTRPDLATIVNILAKHQSFPSDKHISSAKHTIRYVKGTKSKGITFDSAAYEQLSSYLHFPLSSAKVTGVCDSNWGPQDQSLLKPNQTPHELDLFKTRSISGHMIT